MYTDAYSHAYFFLSAAVVVVLRHTHTFDALRTLQHFHVSRSD